MNQYEYKLEMDRRKRQDQENKTELAVNLVKHSALAVGSLIVGFPLWALLDD